MRELSTAVRISDPTPDRFMGDVDPALGEEFLDVTIAQREAEIEPHRVLDDQRRKAVAAVGNFSHRPSLSAVSPPSYPVILTKPYQRIPRMFSDLALARGDGRYPRLMRALGGVKLLILDDWGLRALGPEQRHDMLEIVEDRYGRGATLITSQIPVDKWHDLIGEPTLADAILDRVIHNAHRLQLSGDSLRKQRAPKTIAA